MIAAALMASVLALEPPPPVPPPQAVPDAVDLSGPRRREQTFRTWAGVLSVMSLGLHIGGVVMLHTGRGVSPGLELMGLATFTSVHALVATGLSAGAQGRVLALEGVTPPRWKNPRVGWSLFGAGLAVFVAGHVAPLGCFTTACAVVTHEVGYLGGFTAMMVGLHAAGVGHGYRRGRLSLAPRLRVGGEHAEVGFGISGRF